MDRSDKQREAVSSRRVDAYCSRDADGTITGRRDDDNEHHHDDDDHDVDVGVCY